MLFSFIFSLVIAAILIQVAVFSTTIYLHRCATHRALTVHPAVEWAFKLALFRYAGLKGYRRAAPFFLGLILGEFVVGSLISLLGVLIGTPTYVFWPY